MGTQDPHRRSFEWQKPPKGLVTVIMLWITASRGNLQSAFVWKLSFTDNELPIFENR